ncbi:MAG: type II toxin-antitoxin system VapC family toxin [Acidobacteriia bacterium]|nr:type II toxin-antitoxin system VapC family toxin [Terriglobia bacterium]
MTPRYGIDTSVLVRLVTGHPEPGFEYSVAALSALIENERAEIFASNQVIGEAYIAIQHHYGISKVETRAGPLDVFRSGLVAPLNGVSVIAALEASGGAGLLDRLIANDYARAGLSALTLDKRMATLPSTRPL